MLVALPACTRPSRQGDRADQALDPCEGVRKGSKRSKFPKSTVWTLGPVRKEGRRRAQLPKRRGAILAKLRVWTKLNLQPLRRFPVLRTQREPGPLMSLLHREEAPTRHHARPWRRCLRLSDGIRRRQRCLHMAGMLQGNLIRRQTLATSGGTTSYCMTKTFCGNGPPIGAGTLLPRLLGSAPCPLIAS